VIPRIAILAAAALAALPAAADAGPAPWRVPEEISGRLGSLPFGHDLAVGRTGAVVAAWDRRRAPAGVEAARRERPSQGFGDPRTLEASALADNPAAGVAADGRTTVAWLRSLAPPWAVVLPPAGPSGPPAPFASGGNRDLDIGVDRGGGAVAVFTTFEPSSRPLALVQAADRPPAAAAFAAPVTLGPAGSSDPALAVAPDGRALAAWIGPDGAAWAALRDFAAGWGPPVRVSGPGPARAPAVAIGELGDAVVGWLEEAPMVATRGRSGAWSPPEAVTPPIAAAARGRVALAMAPLGEAVAVGWRQGPAPLSLRVAWRADSSRAWRVSHIASPPRNVGEPLLVMGRSGDALVAWSDPRPVGSRIRARRVPRGGPIGPVEDVSTGDGLRWMPRMVIGNGGVVTASWVARGGRGTRIVAATRRASLV
jgi:hypothetical protein